MSSNRRGAWFWFSTWFPVVLGALIILVETQDFMGANNTNGPFRWIFEHIFGPVSDHRWPHIHNIMRKCGHFFGYGFIGLAWLRAWWRTFPHSSFFKDVLLSLLGTGLIASCDEFHQSFMPNRTGTPWDVLLDCTGAFILQLVTYVFLRAFRPRKLVREA